MVIPLSERALLRGGASALRDQLWSKHEHGTHEYERGDVYVVGEFVLAYQWSIIL